MAKYEATALLYVGRLLVKAGEPFDSDDVPGKNWKPLDGDAKAAVAKRFPKKTEPKAEPDAAPAVEAPNPAERATKPIKRAAKDE